MIDGALEASDSTAKIRRVTSPAFDANDVLDEANSTIETETVPVVISSPSDEYMRRVEGRVDSSTKTITLPSSADITSNRGGIEDEVELDGDTYRVDLVNTIEHPFANVTKQTATIVVKGGH